MRPATPRPGALLFPLLGMLVGLLGAVPAPADAGSDGVEALPQGEDVYLLLVSDHGHMAYHDVPPLVLEDHIYLDGLALIDKGPAVYAWQGTRDPVAAISASAV